MQNVTVFFSAPVIRALLIESLFLFCDSPVVLGSVVHDETVVEDTVISLLIDYGVAGWIMVSSETL